MLTERERKAIKARYADGLKWREVGALLDMDAGKARRVAAKAARKLRHPAYRADPERALVDAYDESRLAILTSRCI